MTAGSSNTSMARSRGRADAALMAWVDADKMCRMLDSISTPIALYSLDPDPRVLFLNSSFVRAFGDAGEGITTLRAWAGRADQTRGFLDWAESAVVVLARDSTIASHECPVTTRNGEPRVFLINTQILDGVLMCSFVDMSDERRSRTRLERTVYELTENIPVGTYTMVLPPGATMAYFSFMSTRFLEMTGLDRETAASDPLKGFACVHPDDYADWVALNAEAFAHKRPFFGQTRLIVRGEVRWITAESIPRDLPDGSTVWEGVLIDVTDRVLAQQRLEESEARLRRILDHVPVPLAVVDTTRGDRITFINRTFIETLGYRLEEIPTIEQFAARSLVDPDQRRTKLALWRAAVERALRQRQPIEPLEIDLGFADGSLHTLIVTAAPLEGMMLVGYLDITRRKAAEAALVAAKEQAERAYQVKSEFLAHMTHELRTPLHAILGFAEVLERRRGREQNQAEGGVGWGERRTSDRRRLDLLAAIQRNGQHLLALINDVLDLSRLERGRLVLQPQVTDLRHLLSDCIADFSPLARENGLSLRKEIDPGLPVTVLIDGLRLIQILNNLLSNAVKFTKAGEILLQARVRPKSDPHGHRELEVSIADTGPGIAPADQALIFDPFVQSLMVEGSAEGTGLGLAICRQLVELMGGRIELDSHPGAGSRFTLTVPVLVVDGAAHGWSQHSERSGSARRWHEIAPTRPRVDAVRIPPAPPVAALLELRALARIGHASRLTQWCRHWSATERYRDFTDRVLRLATSFEHEAIVELADRCLGADNAVVASDLDDTWSDTALISGAAAEGPLILAIDDSLENLRLTFEMLSADGLAMVGVRDGNAGLRAAAALRPDLILLDIGMPGLDGLQVCRLLKADQTTRAIPVIFLTARDQAEDKIRGFEAGGVDYVTKPFNMRELILRVTNHLRLADRGTISPRNADVIPADSEPETALPPGRSLAILVQARDQLLANLTDPPDLVGLARLCGTNRTTLQRLFQEHLGLSVFGFLREQRLQRAQRLLRDGLHSVDSAAHAVGYASGHALSRAFKQRFGVAPSNLARPAVARSHAHGQRRGAATVDG